MILAKWSDLPPKMQNEEVRKYYEILKTRKLSLIAKRAFDIVVSLIMIILLLPFFLIFCIVIKLDSSGEIIFKQKRVTKNGRIFKMLKFRTMVKDAPNLGPAITAQGDPRITKSGKFLRKFRMDEIPQLFNILRGDILFVGVRPEVESYVECYTDEMLATLLMPAGVTSITSILFKDEERLLKDSINPDKTYVEEILPIKMKHNLDYIKNFSFWSDIKIMIMTIFAVIKK